MQIECEYPDGNKRTIIEEAWDRTEFGREKSIELSEDGIYKIYCEVTDLSGHQMSISRQVIVDRTNPVIRKVEQLNKKYYQKFGLNISLDEWIYDFTSYTYMILLDGKVYIPGKEIVEEGWHTLVLQVKDSVGNISEMKTVFKVDHTAPDIVIRGVEENTVYEETAAFQISTVNEEDRIKYVEINGEKQPLNYLGHQYKYAVHESGYYELEVGASDKAGNNTVRHLNFEVQEKRTMVEKVISPVKETVNKKVFSPIKRIWNTVKEKNRDSDSRKEIKKEEKMDSDTNFVSKRKVVQSIVTIGIIFCVGSVWWNRKKK